MKRTRSQRFSGGLEDSTPDPAAEKSTASDPQMAESSSPERKRVRPTFEGEVNEAHVESIMEALRKKPEWQRKVADPDIARRYALEAAQQGASGASIAVALRRLLAEAVAGGNGDEDCGPNFACTLSVPSTRVDEKHGWPVDDEDDDYRVEEDMESLWNDRKIKGPDGHTYRIRERTDIDRVRYVDGAVPDDLRTRLEAQLDAIANVPDKDFHPGSDGKVQDLIHPSLYPYVRGVSFERPTPGGPSADVTAVVTSKAPQSSTASTPTKSKARDDDEEEDEKDDEKKAEDEDGGDEGDAEDSLEQWEDVGLDADTERDYRNEERELDAFTTKSIYQWLPAEFDVAPDGEVSIATYINNLDRARHPELYDTIAQVFRLFLPLFAAVLPGGEQRVYGRRLQVVVKAANYVLQPGQNYDGSWHVEGMPQERIAASGIYYYSTSPHLSADTCLAFRTKRYNSMGERGDAGQGWNFNVNLGSVPTPAGRCLVFANDLQHRVKGMRNDGQEPGVRKILCFFVVDPDERVKSSLDIPPQQWQVQRRLVARALAEAACKVLGGPGRGLPRELVVMITEAAKWGFTKEEAEKHRETLMHERKYYIDANNRLWERPFSFCEH